MSDPVPDPVPVYRGDVLLALGAEIGAAGRELKVMRWFRSRVLAAARAGPDVWATLRDEILGGDTEASDE